MDRNPEGTHPLDIAFVMQFFNNGGAKSFIMTLFPVTFLKSSSHSPPAAKPRFSFSLPLYYSCVLYQG